MTGTYVRPFPPYTRPAGATARQGHRSLWRIPSPIPTHSFRQHDKGCRHVIYHITTRAAWQRAQTNGVYRADSLASEGFIHCSDADQVTAVADDLFYGAKGLLLLHIDPGKLQAEIVYEDLYEADENFPHVYGPIELEAVARVTDFEPGPEGDFYHHHIRLMLAFFEPIETERLRLRPLRLSDAPVVQKLAGERDVAKTVTNIPHPYEDGLAEAWIESTHQGMAEGRSLHLAITLKSADVNGEAPTAEGGRHADGRRSDGRCGDGRRGDGPLIGAIGLQFHVQNRAAELGYWVAVPQWNKGYGTEAAKALVAYGFETLKLHRIFARHMTNNPASGRIMQKIGMTYEGTQRQAVRRFGHFVDLALYGILRDEYEAH